MQLFLDVVFQLSVLAVNVLLPLSLSLYVIGSAVANKSVLKSAFFSGIAIIVLYLVILGLQIKQISDSGTPIKDVLGNLEAILSFGISIILPIIVGGIVVFISNRRFKKIA